MIKETYPLYSSLFLTIKEDALSQLLILVPKQLLVLLRWRMIISVKKSTLRNSFPSKSFVSVKLYRVLEARVLLHLVSAFLPSKIFTIQTCCQLTVTTLHLSLQQCKNEYRFIILP